MACCVVTASLSLLCRPSYSVLRHTASASSVLGRATRVTQRKFSLPSRYVSTSVSTPSPPSTSASASSAGGKEAVTAELELNQVLEANNVTGAVHSYDQNWHAANDPIEDGRAQAVLRHRPDCMLFAVVDGHAGRECAHVVATRLFSYVGAGLIDREDLVKHLNARKRGDLTDEYFHVVEPSHTMDARLPEDVDDIYEENYIA